MNIRTIPLIIYLALSQVSISTHAVAEKSGAASSGIRTPDSFYIWQRLWDERLSDAIGSEKEKRTFYILFRENDGRTASVRVRLDEFKTLGHTIVPVFRIHYRDKWLEKDFAPMLEWILTNFNSVKREFHNSGLELEEFQLDIDCPERLLPNYSDFLRLVKNELGDTKLSVTVLPCQLKNKSFARLAELVDEYILQVHGLDFSRKLGGKISIMDNKTAMDALSSAEALARPFKVAIPSYSYELLFSHDGGKFLGLAAEGKTPDKKQIKAEFTNLDLKDVKSVREKALSIGNCSGVIWFRLPVEGDRLNLDRETIAGIEAGNLPMTGIFTFWEKKNETGVSELFIINRGCIGIEYAVIDIDWKKDNLHDFGLYPSNINISGKLLPGLCPDKIRCRLPSPGQRLPVGWFRCGDFQPAIGVEAKNQ